MNGSSGVQTSLETRAAKKRKSETNTVLDEHSGEKGKAHVIKKIPRKRVKGKLSGLVDLPVDVLFEIFGHLKPFDLLKLSRLTKEFRRLLMSKSSKSVWRAALETVADLPPCPPDLIEPAWVNLVFDPHCHLCFKATVRVVEWAMRLRICSKCAKTKLAEVGMRDLQTEDEPDTYVPFRAVLLSRQGKKSWQQEVLAEDLAEMKKLYAALPGKGARDAFVSERRQFVSGVRAHATLCVTWAQAQTEDRSSELQQLKLERRQAIIEKLEELGYKEDIAGIRYPHSLADHEHVKKAQKLTERIWHNISDSIIKFMDQMHVLRLEREHAQVVMDRQPGAVAVFRTFMAEHHPHPHTDVMPSGLDFCYFPPVKAILDKPTSVVVDETSYADVIPLIPHLIEDWRRNIDTSLVQLKKDNETRNTQDSISQERELDTLKLATTVFRCGKCARKTIFGYDPDDNPEFGFDYDIFDDYGAYAYRPCTLFYPKVKGHACLSRGNMLLMSQVSPVAKLDNYEQRRQWTASPLRFDIKFSKCVKDLVEKAGLDSMTTTAEDMDNFDAWFACLHCAHNCSDNDGESIYESPAFPWRSAVEHFGMEHYRTEGSWSLINPRDIDGAVEALKNNPNSSHKTSSRLLIPEIKEIPFKDATWSCVHCIDTPAEVVPTSMDTITLHLKRKHDIEQPVEDKDYHKHFAALPPIPPLRKVMISLSGKEAHIAQSAVDKRKRVTSFQFSLGSPYSDHDYDYYDYDY